MVEHKYTRRGAIIVEATADEDGIHKVVFPLNSTGAPSINAAKRESRRLQGAALGQGLLHVAA